ncbi:MAG TPA: aminodeoxychorismate/anthranilate synthase component II [Methanothermobacter sp.]|nr:anthranilate synthase component II [Methanothermobacter sp. MT-2]HHW04418.1 aminodeoxychorismate/anthranilate synthase component II [Methanothermobacter sp.]HOK72980.1 aminodeoxychorismate/anthranilate synthase component II [Methanothermobacter sp.]HOL69286.1 aminodeoxychorismate/anthranilate synthase component II [Methanothermobacter sp.]HPQ04504.1 aminodeoxychorismate/anthranilate synthase component II [Methanothermobacter sp.]
MILLIDNYDSFTYNLHQLIGEIIKENGITQKLKILRNDDKKLLKLDKSKIEKIIISPGPGTPLNKKDFGFCQEIIKKFKNKPILGVCLGHQGIYTTFGGGICYIEPVHGKITTIIHNGTHIFKNIPNPIKATRYHSIACDPLQIPPEIQVIAWSIDGIIMAIKHRKYPIYGLQFHPESIGTTYGKKIVKNFLLNGESH